MAHSLQKLDSTAGSISEPQRRRLFGLAQRKGWDIDALRTAVGGSISALSKREASELITRLGGRDLPHEPGHPPPSQRSRRSRRTAGANRRTAGAVRMITPDQVEQIERLGLDYFDYNAIAFSGWLAKDFKLGPQLVEPARGRGWKEATAETLNALQTQIRRLATAQRAGEVIHVLKTMTARRQGNHGDTEPRSSAPSHSPRLGASVVRSGKCDGR